MSLPAISCDLIITSIRTRVDRSLSLSACTPELSDAECLVFLKLRNQNLKAIFQPTDGAPSELCDVKGEFDRKSPSQRLRAILFLLHKQQESSLSFEEFYLRHMSKLVQQHKDMLGPRV